MHRMQSLLALLMFLAPMLASADDAIPSAAAAKARVLDEIVVSGEQPGPGLWKVSKGDHVMWVLGSLVPVPKRMYWQSEDVEKVVAESQQVLLGLSVQVDSGKGLFGSLMLMGSMLGARKNPEKEMLKDMVPADLYARWLVLKQKYLGRNKGVEKRRPIFAAFDLYEKAISRSGLSNSSNVYKVVEKTAKRNDVAITETKVKIKLKDPKAAIKKFKQSPLDDVECFAKTLQHLESDLETMKDRANAWATGDTALLQELSYTDQGRTCVMTMLESSALEGEDFAELPDLLRAAWLKDAEAALTRNTQSFAVLPMRELVGADGYLAELRQRGYTVEAPGEQSAP
jgi:uncharacterized protein YbaP (TraB family)